MILSPGPASRLILEPLPFILSSQTSMGTLLRLEIERHDEPHGVRPKIAEIYRNSHFSGSWIHQAVDQETEH